MDLDELATRTTDAEAALDRAPADLDAELTQRRQPFEPGGPLQDAPAGHWAKVEREIRDRHKVLAGERLFAMEHTARALEVEVQPAIAAAKDPPDPEEAHYRQSKATVRAMGMSDRIQLSVLAELREARLERELSSAQPSAVDAAYARALQDPHEQANASLIRWVERRHGARWAGVTVENNDLEIAALKRLGDRIAATREARVPDALRALDGRVKAIYGKADAMKRDGLRSQRPANWKIAG
jgi:hypothetical protein